MKSLRLKVPELCDTQLYNALLHCAAARKLLTQAPRVLRMIEEDSHKADIGI